MFILKVFILIINQLLSTAYAKDINTDYYITNSTLGREGDPQQNRRVRTWAGSDVFNELFRILVKMRRLYKLRKVSFFFKLTATVNAS